MTLGFRRKTRFYIHNLKISLNRTYSLSKAKTMGWVVGLVTVTTTLKTLLMMGFINLWQRNQLDSLWVPKSRSTKPRLLKFRQGPFTKKGKLPLRGSALQDLACKMIQNNRTNNNLPKCRRPQKICLLAFNKCQNRLLRMRIGWQLEKREGSGIETHRNFLYPRRVSKFALP